MNLLLCHHHNQNHYYHANDDEDDDDNKQQIHIILPSGVNSVNCGSILHGNIISWITEASKNKK
jgi:hypothetical protein